MKLLRKLMFFTRKKHLLQILLDNEELFDNGLCLHSCILRENDIITKNEFRYLIDFIEDNRPKPDSPHYDHRMINNAYYWPVNEWEPRKKWLEDLIK